MLPITTQESSLTSDSPKIIYRHAAEQNYMAHREIHTAIHQHLNVLYDKPFTVLDLGCGDAADISQTLQATLIKRYTGIDSSIEQLQKAHDNLHEANIKCQLLEGDPNHFKSLVAERIFRIIIIGFSLHNLPTEEKQRLFHDCLLHMRRQGRLLIYDVMRRHNEERDEYLQRYHEYASENWPTLSPEALHKLTRYINMYDHPESLESLTTLAKEAGFKRSELLFADGSGFHKLIEFRR